MKTIISCESRGQSRAGLLSCSNNVVPRRYQTVCRRDHNLVDLLLRKFYCLYIGLKRIFFVLFFVLKQITKEKE